MSDVAKKIVIGECNWGFQNQFDQEYHDHRWCKPVHEDGELFAMLCLEGMQAGLSWSIILKRERDIRDAFDQFDLNKVTAYDEEKIATLKENPRIIRNTAKIKAVIKNGMAVQKIQEEFGSFDRYIWSFTKGEVVMNHWTSMNQIPATTELSEKISKDLKKRGFSFVGPVIIYSYLQAIGMVNDHLENCPCKYN